MASASACSYQVVPSSAGGLSSSSVLNSPAAAVASMVAPTRARFCAILMIVFHGARYSVRNFHLFGLATRPSLAAQYRSLVSALNCACSAVW